MNPTDRENNRIAFAAKNLRRKENYKRGAEMRDARDRRRDLHGAFGNHEQYELVALGTSKPTRTA